jgi:prepilin-type N-terminal cleavage/methylation domain-containing protein
MGRGLRARGFTLVEAMMVVVIVGVLGLIASLGYRRWTHTAYLAEATDMVANIRAAEESFRAENGGYITISSSLGPGHDYPAATPGRFKSAWGGSCGGCVNQWSTLNVAPSGPVAFGYALVAANTATTGNGSPLPVPTLTLNGASMDLSAVVPPWYVAEADGDLDGNGVFTHVYGLSATSQIYVDNEGE